MYTTPVGGTCVDSGEIQRYFYPPELVDMLQALLYYQLSHGMAGPCERIRGALTHLTGPDIVFEERVHACAAIGCFSGDLLGPFCSHSPAPFSQSRPTFFGFGAIQDGSDTGQSSTIGRGIEPLTLYSLTGEIGILITLDYQTRKLSPQPQRSSSLGLMNSKPSLSPRRW